MKVCLVNTHFKQGGAAIACRRIWHSLNAYGCHADLLNFYDDQKQNGIFSHRSGEWGKWIAKYHFIKERIFFLPYEHDSITRWNFSTASTGVDISHHEIVAKASVIHLHWINHGFLSIRSLLKLAALGKPIVWTLHDMWAFTGGCHHSRGCENFLRSCGDCKFLKKPGKHDLSERIFLQKEKLYKNLPVQIVTPSKWLASEASRSALFGSKNIKVIPNTLDTGIYRPFEKQNAKRELGLDPAKKLILFMAANASSEYKGALFLHEAFGLLRNRYPEMSDEITLMVAGRIKNNVYDRFPVKTMLAGTVHDEDKIIRMYNAADLFVLPSLEENLPNTIMEAMACGTPCVAFRTGGIPDLIDHMENGFLADYRSAESLMNGMRLLLSDNELLKRMSDSARRKVEANYSFQKVAQKYASVYREMLGQPVEIKS